jgi:hypothetical protein
MKTGGQGKDERTTLKPPSKLTFRWPHPFPSRLGPPIVTNSLPDASLSIDERFSANPSAFRPESDSRREGTGFEGKRRSRKTQKEGEGAPEVFRCGCGKTYMSYPALYTHAKVKHSGIYPEGTYTGVKKKQGRPKVLAS